MKNIYLPQKVKITKIIEESPTVKLFRLESERGFKKDESGMIFKPGQFIIVGKVGYGESPFGVLSSPYENRYMEIAVRRVGTVTNFLHSAKVGDEVEFRGPYGNGFPLDFMKSKDIILVTGGCGIPPIASLLEYICADRGRFDRVYLLYGAKNQDELLLKERYDFWKGKMIDVILTVDQPSPGWKGHIGNVGEIIHDIKVDPVDTVAVMCGPGPMMDAIEKILKPLGISDRRIFVSMERRMQCGVGKCQHCTCGKKYVCLDGPVFNFDEI